jgi:hypothetical protein
MLKLLEFDYSIEYKKGTDNTTADALSRKHTEPHADQCLAITASVPSWMSEIAETYSGDDKCTKLLQELAVNPTSQPHYTLTSGILRYKNRIVIGSTSDLKNRLFNSFHSSIFGGHSGSRVTHHRLKHLFYWPNLKQYIADKVA